MSMTIDLSGRTALVTGSSQGIGAETARVLHEAGARVILNHPDPGEGKVYRDAVGLRDELLARRADSAMIQAADVSDPAAVASMMQAIRRQWDGLDILVNNAGILRDRSIGKMSVEEWRAVIDVNLSGVFYCCKFGLEILRDGGSIVSVGSLSAKMGFHGQSNYAAAKAGVQSLTRVLSRECAKRSIRVNAVAPGVIETPMVAQVSEAARGQLARSIALGRLGRPRDVAEAVLFLCSPLAGYITGHVLEVDGGFLG
ncbi:MAG: SDR family NAD(P)-dependent oxidoreductase [Isosphaeraceae bacterium]